MTNVLLPTSLVGSYAQPGWLIDRKNEKSCIILCFVQEFRADAPQLSRPHAWGEALNKLPELASSPVKTDID